MMRSFDGFRKVVCYKVSGQSFLFHFVSRFPEFIPGVLHSQTSLGRIRNTFIPFALMLCSYGVIFWVDKTRNLDLFKSQKGTLPMTVMTVTYSYLF